MWPYILISLLTLGMCFGDSPVFVWPLSSEHGTLELNFETIGIKGEEVFLQESSSPFNYQPFFFSGTNDSYMVLPVLDEPIFVRDATFRFYIFPVMANGVILHYKATTDKHDYTNGFVIHFDNGKLLFIIRAENYVSRIPSATTIPLYQWTLVTIVYDVRVGIEITINDSEIDKEHVAVDIYIGPLHVPGDITIGKDQLASSFGFSKFVGSITCLQIMSAQNIDSALNYDSFCSGGGSSDTSFTGTTIPIHINPVKRTSASTTTTTMTTSTTTPTTTTSVTSTTTPTTTTSIKSTTTPTTTTSVTSTTTPTTTTSVTSTTTPTTTTSVTSTTTPTTTTSIKSTTVPTTTTSVASTTTNTTATSSTITKTTTTLISPTSTPVTAIANAPTITPIVQSSTHTTTIRPNNGAPSHPNAATTGHRISSSSSSTAPTSSSVPSLPLIETTKAIYNSEMITFSPSTSTCREFRKLGDDVTFAYPEDILRSIVTEDIRSCLQFCTRGGECGTLSIVNDKSGGIQCTIGKHTEYVRPRSGSTMFIQV